MSDTTEIYLDWNATSPPHPEVLEAMVEAAREHWANPASTHATGRRARSLIEHCQETIARVVGVRSHDVLFTSGATEANNLALHDARALITSRLEHPSITRLAERMAEQGVPVEWVSVLSDGTVDLEHLEMLLRQLDGATVAVTAACHETGVIQPVKQIAELAQRHGARLHVDGVQAIGKLEPGEWAEGADTVALSVHKVRGPKGVGVLAHKCGWVPRPLLWGGGQQRNLRPGTLDAALARGLEVAVCRAIGLTSSFSRIAELRDRFDQAFAPAPINGGSARRLPHVTNLSFAGWRGDELVAALDLEGVRISSGSACSAGSAEPAAAVAAMAGRERAESAVRISLGETTDLGQVVEAIERFRRVLARVPTHFK